MTKQALADFANTLGCNTQMARGLAAAIGDRQGDEAAEAAAAYARERGFVVTPEDVAALQATAGDEAGSLSDDQLDTVAGGYRWPSELDWQ
jgi:hypothetical protein